MMNNSLELLAIKQVRSSKDPALPSDFELHSRDGRVVPFSCRWSDLPRIACWLGFGDIDDVTDRLYGWHHFEGFVIDNNPTPDISVEGEDD